MARREVRPIRVEGNLAYIALTQGLEAIIEADDLPLVEGINWHATCRRDKTYAHRSFKIRPQGSEVKLHRVIMSPPPGLMVDHINGDALDCRRVNLRLATNSQNLMNSRKRSTSASKYKGVAFLKARGQWQATIGCAGKRHYLGRFSTEEEAHGAYLEAALVYHGEFANAG